MPIEPLPDHPDLERLKRRAKTLRDLVRAGDDEAISLVREHHPRAHGIRADTPEAHGFPLADAQLSVARLHGLPSWPALRRHLDEARRLSRSPQGVAAGTGPDELLRLVAFHDATDRCVDHERAARALEEHPRAPRHSLFAAAAFGDPSAAREFLAVDPSAASREGGPFSWPPLLYLTYARVDPRHLPPGSGDHLAVAKLLLHHGADPDAGFLWDGLPSPFTALTGVFGGGEQRSASHPAGLALAEVLLAAGAEANDNQTIYNRGAGDATARDDTDFLELLLDHGLGRGDGGPWRRRLGSRHPAPEQIAADALQHAAEQGLPRRADLLLRRGTDPDRASAHPLYRGRSPYEGAVLHGNDEVAAMRESAGADISPVGPQERLVGAVLSADRPAAMLAAGDAALLRECRRHHGDLVARAAARSRPEAVLLSVDLGFDVDALRGTTALHEAAVRGETTVVDLLLELGADPSLLDTTHHATAAGWAHHGGHPQLAEHLEDVTGESAG